MAQRFRTDPGHLGQGFPIIGVNSQAFATADPVLADTSGWLDVISTSSKVLGYATHDATMASDNQTVATIKPSYVFAPGILMQYTADQAATQTDVGAYADVGTATSGSIQLNLAAGTSGQFFVLGFDPDNDDSTSEIVVEVAEPQVLAFTQD